MQVHLKQSEIVTALKQYISGEGISLQGKTVDMTFTAGRKESGISVEISIEDASIPDFFKDTQEDAQAPAPTGLTLVQGTAPATASVANDSTEQAPAVETTAQATGTDDAFFKEETAAPGGGVGKVVEAETTTLVPAGKSLFS